MLSVGQHLSSSSAKRLPSLSSCADRRRHSSPPFPTLLAAITLSV
ncbi:hypothetical protein A2U01_0042038, partial [Trifolium medium]|nr:hypothetical protein [Trifolium medium]